MSLESKIDEMIVALNANTKALGGKPGTAATATAGAKGTTAPTVTFEMVKAKVVAVKDMKGKPAAQTIIKTAGKATELAGIKPVQFAAVIKACDDLLNEETTTEAEVEEDPDSL